MSETAETPRSRDWRVISAVVIGSDHRRDGSPCQDAASVLRCVREDGEHLIVVVSDGAGSARLSAEGSRITCETVAQALETTWNTNDIGTVLVAAARAALDAEATRVGAATADFACTLVAARIGPSESVLVQVGDGAIVMASGGAAHEVVFWPTKGEYANQTVFVTSPGVSDHIQTRVVTGPVDEVALLTDGLENVALDFAGRTVFAGFFAPFFGAVRGLDGSNKGDEMALSDDLGAFLASERVDGVTGDDRTLVVASRREA